MKLRMTALILAALLGAGACGDSTAPEITYGTYALQSIAGVDVPTVIPSDEAAPYDVLSGSMHLTAEGTFTMSVSVRLTLGGTVRTETRPEAGLFTVSGGSISFSAQSGEAWSGSIFDRALTTVVDGLTWVWEQ